MIGFTSDTLLGSDQEKYTYRSLILYETNSFCLRILLSYHANKTGLSKPKDSGAHVTITEDGLLTSSLCGGR